MMCPATLHRSAGPHASSGGERDPLIPRTDQDVLLSAMRASTLQVCENLGHAPHWDRPDMVARLVVDFLNPQNSAPSVA